MAKRMTIPDLQPLIEPLLGTAYADMQCRTLVEHLFFAGFGVDLRSASGVDLNQHFQELWFWGDPRDPLALWEPWDLVLFTNDVALPVSEHTGVVLDARHFVHARPAQTGVALGRLRSWRTRLVQLARYRELL
jgi:hypothetical protein